MSLIRNRQPRGTSAGGQFAPDLHSEPGIHLDAPSPSPARFSRFEDRPGRKRRSMLAARTAVAALVLAASASLTGCGAGGSSDCPSAAVYDAPASTAAYISTGPSISAAATAAFVPTHIDVQAKGSGGGHGGGGGHSSGGHSSGESGGHESTTGGGHDTGSGSSGTSAGSGGSSGWAPHFWPFSGGHSNTCHSPAAKHA